MCVCFCLCAQQEMIPFAVVGSDQEYQVNGKKILGRKTKWGTIEGNTYTYTYTHTRAGVMVLGAGQRAVRLPLPGHSC